MQGRIKYLPRIATSFVVICVAASSSLGQSSVQNLRNALRDEAAFTADDFSTVERGEIVVKVLPVKDRREVAVFGLVRTPAAIEKSLRAFQTSMTQQNQSSILQGGKFSNPPIPEDLQGLTLENRDFESLKLCVVGKCKVKMSAAMIEHFRSEVDWGAADCRLQATRLFRQMLLDYVRDYLLRGDAGLIEYQDQIRGVRLNEEQRSLLENSLYINDFAPELTQYVNGFPGIELMGVENTINWTKIKFGLKPVTLITHVITYRRRNSDASQIVVVSRQIYANHYFDSSLSVAAFIDIPTTGVAADSYLLYTNRSRADALAGAFSKLKRRLVETQGVDSLKDLLAQTKANLAVSLLDPAGPVPPSGGQQIVNWLLGRRLLWPLLVAVILLIGLLLISKRNSKRTSAVFEKDN
jgi:hypothetical protein